MSRKMSRKTSGQSQIEFLIGMAVLLPFAILLPTLANMLLLQTEAHKSARHVAWERTAYPNDQLKTSEQLSVDVEDHFLRYSNAGLAPGTAVAATQWRDWKTMNSMVDYPRDVAVQVNSSRSATEGYINASSWLAGRGRSGGQASAIQLDTLQSSELSIPLRSDISILQLTRPVTAWTAEPDPEQPGTPIDPVRQAPGYYLRSSSALVADGWVAGNNAIYHDRVADIGRFPRSVLPVWANLTGASFFSTTFRELADHLYVNTPGTTSAFDMVDPNQSVNLPSGLKRY